MKRPRIFWIFLIIFLLIAIAALILFYKYNPKKAVNLILPDFSKVEYINAFVEKDSVKTKVDVIVENKSPYKLDIDSASFEILLNDQLLLTELIPLNLKQKRYQVDTIQLPIDLSKKKLKHVIGDLKGTDSTNLTAHCYIIYNTVFGRVKLKYDKVIRIAVPVPPQIKVVKVERKKYNVAEKILNTTIFLQIINGGPTIHLKLYDIHYQLQVENELSSEGAIDKTVLIKPRSTETLEIPVDIKVEHPLKTIIAILTDNDQMNYSLHLKGKMIEKMVDLEKQDPIPVEINATGKLELKK
jgi:LEA14-like dessication related protein